MKKRLLVVTVLSFVLCFAFVTTAFATDVLVHSAHYSGPVNTWWDTNYVTRPSQYSQWTYIRDANYLSCINGNEGDTYPPSREHKSLIVLNNIALSSTKTVTDGANIKLTFSQNSYKSYSQVSLRIKASSDGPTFVNGYVRGYIAQ